MTLIDRGAIQQAKEQLGDRNADLMQEILQMEKYNPQRRLGCCPNPDHDDHTPSCSYDPKRHLFHCFSCGYTIDLVSAYMLDGTSFVGACRKLFEAAGYQYDFSEIDRHTKIRDYRYPNPKYAANRDRVNAYWKSRQISEKTLDHLDVQEDEHGNSLLQYYDLTGDLVTVSKSTGFGICQTQITWIFFGI